MSSIPEFTVVLRFHIRKKEAEDDDNYVYENPDKPGINSFAVNDVNDREDNVENNNNKIECFKTINKLFEFIHPEAELKFIRDLY